MLNAAIGTSRDFTFDYETMPLGEDLRLRNFVGSVRFNRTPQGLLLQAGFAASADLECVRCLTEFAQALQWELTELYAFDRRSMTESELLVPEDGYIDLEPLLREYALLEFPISPICKTDCKGLCPVCGENRNQTDCGHRPESDSPFAVLKEILG